MSGFLVPYTSFQHPVQKIGGQNRFGELNWHVLTFLRPILFTKAALFKRTIVKLKDKECTLSKYVPWQLQ
jgi:hypothetical protein